MKNQRQRVVTLDSIGRQRGSFLIYHLHTHERTVATTAEIFVGSRGYINMHCQQVGLQKLELIIGKLRDTI
jgi:hypothetical protein